jgi:hypothetical protein
MSTVAASRGSAVGERTEAVAGRNATDTTFGVATNE